MLTERGVLQARALAERLADTPPPAVLVCSPLRRARHTASIVADRLAIPVAEVAEDLREVDVGTLDGRGDPASWRTYEDTLAAWSRGDLDARFPGGEDAHELVTRLRRALTHAAELADLAGRGGALVVAHGANLRAVVPSLMAAPDPGTDLVTGGIALLEVSPSAAAGPTARGAARLELLSNRSLSPTGAPASRASVDRWPITR